MQSLDVIQSLMNDPAPGLAFGRHDRAGVARRVHPTRHEWGPALSPKESAELHRLLGDTPELADLKAIYTHGNGLNLFYLKCPNCDDPHWALSFLPVREWAQASKDWRPGGTRSWAIEECPMYDHGQWSVIATLPSEEMNLVQFFSGEYEGQNLAGKVFCIGLDGYMGHEEELAPSISALFQEIREDPAAFFERLGFSWSVQTDAGLFGDPIEAYLVNHHTDPDAKPWPPTRPHR